MVRTGTGAVRDRRGRPDGEGNFMRLSIIVACVSVGLASVVAAPVVAGAATGAPAGAAQATRPAPTARPAATYYSGAGTLRGVAAASSSSAWAVSWVRSFPFLGTYHALNGIAAGPGGTAFAVGADASTTLAAISMKWAGTAWQKVTVNAPADSQLNAVTFAPGGVAWAAGNYYSGAAHTLIMRWAGTAWTRVTSPGTGEGINGLAFSASGYGWAVGQTFPASGSPKTVILHWNGTTWSASPPGPPPPPTAYSTAGALAGVAAVSASSAWAVGYAGNGSSPQALMVAWNGAKWSRVTSPAVLAGAGALTAVTVVSATSAWAVGYTGTPGSSRTLLLHWNGTAWSQVTSPAPVAGVLDAVTATGSGGWAAGYVPNGGNWPKPLILRLSGTTWSQVTVSGAIEVVGVTITGASSAWAVGHAEDLSVLGRWNGSTWTWQIPGSGSDTYYLNGIAAGSGGTAFTVGTARLGSTAGALAPVSLKLTGSTWGTAAVNAPSNATLNAVTVAPGGLAWAAGATGPHALLLRWTGSAWARVTSPSPGGSSVVSGLGFAAAGDGWAVGASDAKTLIVHWNGTTWS
jgi:hypothetical protein